MLDLSGTDLGVGWVMGSGGWGLSGLEGDVLNFVSWAVVLPDVLDQTVSLGVGDRMVWHVGRDGSLGGRYGSLGGRDGLSCLGLDGPFLFLMGLVAWSIAI